MGYEKNRNYMYAYNYFTEYIIFGAYIILFTTQVRTHRVLRGGYQWPTNHESNDNV